ncbi:MAG: 5-formyltetrahydrofolate cyclo-ligase [Gammaproteobacteria bacterium]
MNRPLTKEQIRQACIAQRKSLSQKFIVESSQKIADIIQDLPVYQAAQHLAWYFPVKGEVDLTTLWELALKKNKNCYFPVIQTDQNLQFLPYTLSTQLKLNQYQILEPSPEEPYNPIPPLDIIFLPTVAFDAHCTRLGMGKGYYDKTLIIYPDALIIGVAYEWQKQMTLPRDPWDIKPHMIITEERIYS